MVKIVLTPEWFVGKDIMIELFSLIVLIIFVALAYKYYRVNRNRKILYLGVGFGLIALAQLATILNINFDQAAKILGWECIRKEKTEQREGFRKILS